MHARPSCSGPALLLLAGLVAQSPFVVRVAVGSPELQHAPQGTFRLEDPAERLLPRNALTEAEQNRQEAMRLFAAGRLAEQREDFSTALRKYQRAFRLAPQSTAIGDSVVRVAVQQRRYAEAVRYAMLLDVSSPESLDSLLLLKLGSILAEADDWDQALTVYQKVLSARSALRQNVADIYLWMEMGRLYHLTNKDPQAAERFARVLYALEHPKEFGLDDATRQKLLREPGLSYQLYGEVFLPAGRAAEAQAAFEKAATPDATLQAFNRARVAWGQKKPDEALAQLQIYFDRHADAEGLLPYELLAEVLKAQGKTGELIPRLEKLQHDAPKSAPLALFLADRYRECGALDKAEPIYRELLKRGPNVQLYRCLAEIYRKQGRSEPLLNLLGLVAEKTLGLDSVDAEAKLIRDNAALLNSLIETARDQRHGAPTPAEFGPDLAVGLLTLGDGRYEAAGEFLSRAMAADPKRSGDILLFWTANLLSEDLSQQALDMLQPRINDPAVAKTLPTLEYLRAGALEMLDRHDEALAAARRAIDLKPGSARFAARPAWVLYHAKRYADARAAYAEIIRKYDPEYSSQEARQSVREAKLMISNLCTLDNHPAEADEWLEQVLDEYPNDAGALNDLGYLWTERGVNLHRAHRMLQNAVSQEPDNLAYRDSLGWSYYQLERYEEALAEIQKAVDVDKPDAVVLDHLGDVQWKLNHGDQARDAWRKAAAAFRKDGEHDKAQRTEHKIHDK